MSTYVLSAWYGSEMANEVKTDLIHFGWAIFGEYLKRAGFQQPGKEILEPSNRFKNILVAMHLFSSHYDKAPPSGRQLYESLAQMLSADPALQEQVWSDAGVATTTEFELMISWCPDQATMIRLGIGPYVEFGAEAPKSVCDLIAGQLQVEPSYFCDMNF